MNMHTERHVFATASYLSQQSREQVADQVDSMLEGLEDDMSGASLVSAGDSTYTFSAAGSQVDVTYELDESEIGTQIDLTYEGAAPLVERFYDRVGDEWMEGELEDL